MSSTLVQHCIKLYKCFVFPGCQYKLVVGKFLHPRSKWRIQDLKKGGGAPGVLGACLPKIFLVDFSQFRGLFKVFGENKGGGGASSNTVSLFASQQPSRGQG